MIENYMRDYTRMSCNRLDKPETIAFVYPADHLIIYNRAAHPSANIYDLCFDCAGSNDNDDDDDTFAI